jgi:hypothetical protein
MLFTRDLLELKLMVYLKVPLPSAFREISSIISKHEVRENNKERISVVLNMFIPQN